MGRTKLFLSHSEKDAKVVSAFVHFMFSIGLKEEDMFCSSSPELHIPICEDIYQYLREQLDNEKVYVIYFLSDNYYNSPVCLNEMGAAWVKQAHHLAILLPGFGFNNMKGVIGSQKVGISLGTLDAMTKSQFTDFKTQLELEFGITPSTNHWETARDNFLQVAADVIPFINMKHSEGFCIGDTEHDGCRILTRGLSTVNTSVTVDFSKTTSDLCSMVFYINHKDWRNHFANKRQLCFDIYADLNLHPIDVEIHAKDHNIHHPILVSQDGIEQRLSLQQFIDDITYWETVNEIAFLFRRKDFQSADTITIHNLRLE